MKFNCVFKLLILSILMSSSLAIAGMSGRQQCSSYFGGNMLVFKDMFTSKDISIAFVGNGLNPYKWGYYKISRIVKGDCPVCFNFYTDYVMQNDNRVKIKIETRQNSRATAMVANVYTKSNGNNWSYWHSGLRCLDWNK